MKKTYSLILSVIIAITPSLTLFAGNKHPRAKTKLPEQTQSSMSVIDSDDDDYIAPQPPRAQSQRSRPAILRQSDPDERIQALEAQVADLKNAIADALEQALKRGQKIDALVPKAEKLKATAQKIASGAQEVKEQAKIGFSGPLNDLFNGASFALATIFYGTLLYDEYMSLQNNEVKEKTGFARFALQRFCEFKWSLTEAARIAWVAIIAKIMFDYYG